jgi:uncharacterized protein DUF5615
MKPSMLPNVGKAGWKDWNVVRYASDGDFVLVTNNASDFRRLYAKRPLHAGLVIIIPNVSRIIQQRLFRGALDVLVTMGEPINRVLEVDIEGDEVTFDLYDLPRKSTLKRRAPDLILGGSCLVRQKLDRGRLFPEVTRPARGSFGNFRVT